MKQFPKHFSLLKVLVFLAFFIFCIASQASFSNTDSFYPLETQRQEAQFHHLLKNLRCLVCQNQDLADSNASLAKDLREKVYQMVKANQTDNDIIEYLVSRYGDFILFKPPIKPVTYLLWFGPFLFLGLGCVIFWRYCLRQG